MYLDVLDRTSSDIPRSVFRVDVKAVQVPILLDPVLFQGS